PLVTDYISKSIGPKAVLTDLAKTARVVARFGPRLPGMVENALLRQTQTTDPSPSHRLRERVFLAVVLGLSVGFGSAATVMAVMAIF
ncbi:MAG: 2-polyprenylphenol 6-hydroxylase, partial [Tateyamaria sp.]